MSDRPCDAVITVEEFDRDRIYYYRAEILGRPVLYMRRFSNGQYLVNSLRPDEMVRNANDQVEVWMYDKYRYKKALDQIAFILKDDSIDFDEDRISRIGSVVDDVCPDNESDNQHE